MSLRQKTIRGLKFASLGTAGKTAVDIAVHLVLIRLLMPEAFGIFAVAQALTGLISCFSDFAGLKFLIRFKDKSSEHFQRAISSVFWFELLVGILIAGIWVLAAPVVFSMNNSPGTTRFAQALAIWIIAERFMIPRALMDRALDFASINIALFSGVVVAGLVMLIMSLTGAGPWVLVVGLIVRTLIAAGMMWWKTGFRPRLRTNRKIVHELLFFGSPLMLTTVLTFYYTNIDYVIVQYWLGDRAAGIYYNAYRYPHYLIQFNMILGSVAFPAFTKAKDPVQFARGLGLITRYAGSIGFAAMICMWMEGRAIVNVLLGDPEKWEGALFPFQVFATLAGLRLTYTHWGHWFIIKGNMRPLVLAAIWNVLVLTIATVLATRYFGIDGAAIAVTAVSISTIFFCCFVWLKDELEFSYLKALKPVLIATAITIPCFILLGTLIPGDNWWGILRTMLGMVVYGTVMGILCGPEALRLFRNRA